MIIHVCNPRNNNRVTFYREGSEATWAAFRTISESAEKKGFTTLLIDEDTGEVLAMKEASLTVTMELIRFWAGNISEGIHLYYQEGIASLTVIEVVPNGGRRLVELLNERNVPFTRLPQVTRFTVEGGYVYIRQAN